MLQVKVTLLPCRRHWGLEPGTGTSTAISSEISCVITAKIKEDMFIVTLVVINRQEFSNNP